MNQQALSSLIWSVADLLRGDFKQSEYGRVILPFTVLRRLDCVLAPTKAEVLKEYATKQAAGIAFEPFVKRKAGLDFYNVSSLDMGKLMGDQDNVRANLDSYIQGFAPDVRSIFEHFDFAATVERLHKAMLIRGQDISNIILGNTLSDDGLFGKLFDYMLSNPPFGVEWKKIEKAIRDEHEKQGYNGRFGPGLPRVSDGSLLFLLHLLSKMRPAVQGGSRVGIVLNGSPLFTGGAGSGESEIRRYVLENDLVEAIVALPTDMFYNTGISTYIWILSNRKPEDRKGYVQLIDASSFWQKMRKSLGSKRKEMGDEHIAQVTKMFGDFVEASLVTVVGADGKEVGRQVLMDGETLPSAPAGGKVKVVPVSRIFRNEEFGYRTITVERPLRDEAGKAILGEKGNLPEPHVAAVQVLAQVLSEQLGFLLVGLVDAVHPQVLLVLGGPPQLLQHAQRGVAAGGQHVAVALTAPRHHQGIVEAVSLEAGLYVLDLLVGEEPGVVVVDVDVGDLQEQRPWQVLDGQIDLGGRGVAHQVARLDRLRVPLGLVGGPLGGASTPGEGAGLGGLQCVHHHGPSGSFGRTLSVHPLGNREVGQGLRGRDGNGQPDGLGVLGSGHDAAPLSRRPAGARRPPCQRRQSWTCLSRKPRPDRPAAGPQSGRRGRASAPRRCGASPRSPRGSESPPTCSPRALVCAR
jgi:type I restriction-modification system DNA methylase subunit